MNFMKYEKLLIPVSIIIWCIIIWISIIINQSLKQKSIEYQKRLDIELEKEKLDIERDEIEAQQELKKKEYIANRKKDCLEIYESEKKNWSNTNSYSYNILSDTCSIEYKDNDWKEWDITSQYFTKNF